MPPRRRTLSDKNFRGHLKAGTGKSKVREEGRAAVAAEAEAGEDEDAWRCSMLVLVTQHR